MAWLSILGLYNYDNTIFDGLRLPAPSDVRTPAEIIANPPELDKETLIKYICMELAELSVVYASPVTIKEMITVWSDVHFNEWLELYTTLLYSYNPIWNKDGERVHHVEGDLHLMTGGHTTTVNMDQTTTDTNDVTGFDTNDYSKDTRRTSNVTGKDSDNRQKLTYNSQKDHANYMETDTERGNIGVTTTQAMLKEQRDVVQFNLYDFICQQFKREFCVMVW